MMNGIENSDMKPAADQPHIDRLDAVSYLEPVALAPLDGELSACLMAAKSSSPICCEVQARSDLSFTEEIVSTLTEVDLDSLTAQQGV